MQNNLEEIAGKMVAKGKGILAADESTGTIGKRFDSINLENNENNRLAYRQLLLSSSEAMENYIGGVILFEETLYQKTPDGTPLADLIAQAGAVVGIKVDKGLAELPNSKGENITQGLEGLAGRLNSYYEAGARFAKWRAVITIGDGLPTQAAIDANAESLAAYALLCQTANIVPIVEPEVQMDKEPANHTIEQCFAATQATLKSVFAKLKESGVKLESMVLKPNMVLAGSKAQQAGQTQIVEKTYQVLKAEVPNSVAGIAFLSGGQSDIMATENLNALNVAYGGSLWPLTFSYGRALQEKCREIWAGKNENVEAAQDAFTHRAKMNSLASMGRYNSSLEKMPAS